ncbi:ABC transporter permease [Paenibacillus sacheonensis]|uniref:ABC transporter permease subunit n=1 Tax=Paenibacillus sacheonensis TaxID=742054 RepID=A0A7X5BYN6_9BACL|nr:ABC transporter permease [Paenibacillus sacheonensis]MBM7567345.1 ABC-2 type transport system permease protein [Paenibacillus sacheonensis]NBC69872.1 ABC transporter permease subunit [Paenibacillus sacheonensis]
MYNFLQLVRNENMKIYRRIGTWIMFAIILVIVVVVSILSKVFDDNGTGSLWSVMNNIESFTYLLITIFTVVVSAESVAGEFSSGTIKLLLIRPWSRSKILLSKYIALLQFALTLSIVMLISSFVLNLVLFGYGDAKTANEALGVANNSGPFSYMLQVYVLDYIGLIMIVTLSFMLSTLFRSGGLAIGLSMFIYFFGIIASGLLSMLDYAWVDYLLFLHLNLKQYLGSEEITHNLTMGFSLSVLVGYYLLFVAITWYVFNRRDVAT